MLVNPRWPAQSWYQKILSLVSTVRSTERQINRRALPDKSVLDCAINCKVQADWKAGIFYTILSRAEFYTHTGGAAEAARLSSHYGWAASTWRNRSGQLRGWLQFCDHATKGDVLDYIGFHSLEGMLSFLSLLYYITALSRYHELYYMPSPTKTPLILTAMAAYACRQDDASKDLYVRFGCPAHLVRRLV